MSFLDLSQRDSMTARNVLSFMTARKISSDLGVEAGMSCLDLPQRDSKERLFSVTARTFHQHIVCYVLS